MRQSRTSLLIGVFVIIGFEIVCNHLHAIPRVADKLIVGYLRINLVPHIALVLRLVVAYELG